MTTCRPESAQRGGKAQDAIEGTWPARCVRDELELSASEGEDALANLDADGYGLCPNERVDVEEAI